MNTLWFSLIAVLWTGYFFLEGFDFGVGILLPFLGRNDADRRVLIRTIGPVWFVGSVLPAVLWGIAFADLLHGVPIGSGGDYAGDYLDLLQPYALLGGATFLLVFTLHGALFLALRTRDDLAEQARRAAIRLWPPAAIAVLVFLAWTFATTPVAAGRGVVPDLPPIGALAAVLAVGWLVRARLLGWAFAATGIAIVLLTATFFLRLYPRVMVSSLGPSFDLTISNASSSPYTLGVMSIVAAVFLPLVLAYQAWTYWVFRRRIGRKDLAGGY